jgi:hypothetical protein
MQLAERTDLLALPDVLRAHFVVHVFEIAGLGDALGAVLPGMAPLMRRMRMLAWAIGRPASQGLGDFQLLRFGQVASSPKWLDSSPIILRQERAGNRPGA